MHIYETKDYTGATCRHFAVNPSAAIQAHLVHFGLLSLSGPIEVTEITQSLRKEDVCNDPYCQLAGEDYAL